MNADTVRKEYQRKCGKPMSEADLRSFFRLAYAFDCLDAEGYEDAQAKIVASLTSISEELEVTDNPTEQYEIVMRRYGLRL